MKTIKLSFILVAFVVLCGFAPELSAKHHGHRHHYKKTSFSFGLNLGAPIVRQQVAYVAPPAVYAAPVYPVPTTVYAQPVVQPYYYYYPSYQVGYQYWGY